MGILISLDKLQEGWYLDKPVTKNGVLLYAEGTVLTESKIQSLQKHLGDIKNTRVEIAFQPNNNYTEEEIMLLEYQNRINNQDYDIEGSVSKETKDETIGALKNVFVSPHNSLKDTVSVINKCINNIAYQVNNDRNDFSYSLGQYKDEKKKKDLLEHSFRVAQFAVALGAIHNHSILGTGKKCVDLESIGTAALLHDYGQRYADPNEMKKLAVYHFTDDFFEKYPTIPRDILKKPYNPEYNVVYAYAALKNAFSSSVCEMVLNSFEKEDGRLFEATKDNNISNNQLGGKIIYLCNLYDSLLANAISMDYPLENVSSLMDIASVNNVINTNLYQLFKNNIPLYSVGVRVQLSTGEYATVIERYLGEDNSKPMVLTLVNPPEVPRLIDLRQETKITIASIVSSEEKLSEKLKNITDMQLEEVEFNNIVPIVEEQDDIVHKSR